MGRMTLAFKAFFRILGNAAIAAQVEQALRDGAAGPAATQPALPSPAPRAAPAPAPKPPARSEALTLLAALQREARFIDLVQEPLDAYSDTQIGAAARDVLRDCRGVLNRLFAIEPLLNQDEGSPVDVPPGYDAGRFRLTGNITGQPPFRGQLVHHGWQAAHCQLPVWSGSQESTHVIAAAEVEVE